MLCGHLEGPDWDQRVHIQCSMLSKLGAKPLACTNHGAPPSLSIGSLPLDRGVLGLGSSLHGGSPGPDSIIDPRVRGLVPA